MKTKDSRFIKHLKIFRIWLDSGEGDVDVELPGVHGAARSFYLDMTHFQSIPESGRVLQ